MKSLTQPARFYGRAFEIELRERPTNRRSLFRRVLFRRVMVTPGRLLARLVILPCDICGTPLFPGADSHVCIALQDHLLEYELAVILGEDIDA